jgi:hypothetical protein
MDVFDLYHTLGKRAEDLENPERALDEMESEVRQKKPSISTGIETSSARSEEEDVPSCELTSVFSTVATGDYKAPLALLGQIAAIQLSKRATDIIISLPHPDLVTEVVAAYDRGEYDGMPDVKARERLAAIVGQIKSNPESFGLEAEQPSFFSSTNETQYIAQDNEKRTFERYEKPDVSCTLAAFKQDISKIITQNDAIPPDVVLGIIEVSTTSPKPH